MPAVWVNTFSPTTGLFTGILKPGKCFHQFTYRVQRFFYHRCFYFGHKIIDDRDGACQVAHCQHVPPFHLRSGVIRERPAFTRFQHIGGSKIIIVMRMKIKMYFRITVYYIRKQIQRFRRS